MEPCAHDEVILLMGMPRSGTTWLGKLFDSHPLTLYRHEPDAGRKPLRVDARREEVRAFVAELAKNRSPRCSAKAPWFAKDYDTSLRRLVRGPMLQAFRIASRVAPTLQVPDLLPRDVGGQRPRIVMKSIECSDLIGRVAAVLPNSRNIAIVRHPCGYVASVLRGTRDGKFSSRTAAYSDARAFDSIAATSAARQRGVTAEDIWNMTPVERLAWRWVAFSTEMLASVQQLPNAYVLRYEDLCAAPLEVTRALFDFAGLAWSEQTAGFIEASTSQDDRRFYSVFKNPAKSVNKWRTELTGDEIRRVLRVTRGTLPGALFDRDCEPSECPEHSNLASVPA